MKRKIRGFTMTELLVTIGILVILIGVSIPGIVTIQRKLAQRQLDDYAREIFVAAQNQMSARAVAGTLSRVEDASTPDPADDCSWLTDNGDVETLLEGDAMVILESGSYCMIKYNSDTAAVLEVYYAREPMDGNAVIAGMYSDEIDNNINRRKENHIGYFRGDDAEAGRVAYMPTPTLTVENGEELTVKVSVPSSEELGGDIRYKVTLTVQQLKANGQPEADRQFQTELGTGNAFSFEETMILDSLVSGKHFYEITQEKVTPGSNITVTATVSYVSGADKKLAYLASSASERSNGLFAGLDSSGTAKIANGRHMQNLSTDVSKVSGITKAVQTEIVNWALDNGTRDYYAQHYPDTYDNGEGSLCFQPISNAQLRSYDGKSNEIQCLKIKVASGSITGAGLFASMSGEGSELKNISILCPNISNLSVSNNNNVSTGALAGYLNGVTVTNCRCYGEYGYVLGNTKFVGGLIGRANNCVISKCFAQLFRLESDCGMTVGGLIGSAAGGKAEYCYANIGRLSVDPGTGLDVWDVDKGMKSTGKTAGGTVYTPGNIGGLIGQGTGNLEINNCYSCGFASAGASACGILGSGSSITAPVASSYSVLSYGRDVTAAYGIAERNNLYDNNTAYWLGGRDAELYITGKNGGSAIALLTRPTGSWMSAGVTYPYGGTPRITSGVYPYAMINGLPHYGDWPPPEAAPTKAYIFSGLTSADAANYSPYTVNDSYHVSLEQISGGAVGYNQKTITAYAVLNINGQESTPHGVVWQVYTGDGADGGWTTITESSVNISSGGRIRATLHRDYGDNTYAGNNTGGSIVVKANNADEYAEDVGIQLRVRSILSSNANEWTRVNVKIMRKLRLDPPLAVISTSGGSGKTVFNANRSNNDVMDSSYGWTPQWQISINSGTATAPTGGVSSGNSISYTQSYAQNSAERYFIVLNWGPYTSNAILETSASQSGTVASCTGDGKIEGDSTGVGDYYCIIEKGSHRSLSFYWSGAASALNEADVGHNINELNSGGLVTFDAPAIVPGTTGSISYNVTGNEYSDTGTTPTARWQATSLPAVSSSCDIYVVGIEADGAAAKTTERGGGPVSFKVKTHFPGNILSTTPRTYTWSTESNPYIAVDADASDHTKANTRVLTANTSGTDKHVKIYCRYAVGSTRFTYTQVFTVTIPSMTLPAFQKCGIGDLDSMPDTFATADNRSRWIEPVTSGTDWRLTAGGSIFIKTASPYIRGGTEPDYTYYDAVMSESSDDIEIHSFTGSDHITYFRIDAVGNPASPAATATVTVGPWSGTLSFSIVQPSLTGRAYTKDDGGQQTNMTVNGEGYYECGAGTDMYLELTGGPDLSGLAVSGLEGGKLTAATIPALDYTTGTYELRLSAAAVTGQTDVALTVTSARYPGGLEVKIRIVPAPAPQPAPAPPVYEASTPTQKSQTPAATDTTKDTTTDTATDTTTE